MRKDCCVRIENIAATFDASAADYEHSAPELINFAASELIQRLQLEPDHRFVDLGCGPGTLCAFAEPVLAHGEMIGVDLSRVQLARARERMRRSPIRPRFLHQDATATELASRYADAVGLGFVLPYAERPERLLKEATRLARIGGRVAATMLGHPFFGAPGNRVLALLERRGVAAAELQLTTDPRQVVQHALLCEVDGRRLDNVTIEALEREFWWEDFDEWWNMLRAWGFLPIDRDYMLNLVARDMRDDDRVVDPDGRVRCQLNIWLLSATVSEGDPWL